MSEPPLTPPPPAPPSRRATRAASAAGTFVVHVDDLRRLGKVCLELTGREPECSVACSDGIVRSMTLNDLCSYENGKGNRITAVVLSAVDEHGGTDFEFQMGRRRPIEFEFSGYEHQVVAADADLMRILDAMQTWYDVLDRVVAALKKTFLIVSIVTVTLVLNHALGTVDLSEVMDGEKVPPVRAVVTTLLAGIGVAILPRVRAWLRALFIPPVTFAIGQGEERYKFDEAIRRGTVLTVVTLVGGGLVTWLLR